MRLRGLMIDLDGTLTEVGKIVPGVIEALGRLRQGGLSLRFVTNTTRRPQRQVLERMRELGIEAEPEELFTASTAAATWLAKRKMERIAPRVTQATMEDFSGFTFDESDPQAVVVGDLGSDWTFDVMNSTFRQLLAGAELVALQAGRFWITEDGPTIDAGAWITGLEYAAGVSAHVVGKPNREFFEAALASMGVRSDEVAMVGDDVFNDVDGAQRAGMTGALVRTGKFRQELLDRSGVTPDLILDSFADLPDRLTLPRR
jgi:HAD superfamily hydrolase (TIGR01458 family)